MTWKNYFQHSDTQKIKQNLTQACNVLSQLLTKIGWKSELHLILVKGALLILKRSVCQRAGDLDGMPQVETKIPSGIAHFLSRYGFLVIPETFLYLHPDYEDRLEPLEKIGKIHLWGLGSYDLALSKIAACRGREELQRLIESDLFQQIDLKKLKQLYFEGLQYWVGNENKLKNNWNVFISLLEKSEYKEKLKELGEEKVYAYPSKTARPS